MRSCHPHPLPPGRRDRGPATGEPISHQSTWRILQTEGARIRTEEGELVTSVFELGEAPPDTELVVVEADGTFLAA